LSPAGTKMPSYQQLDRYPPRARPLLRSPRRRATTDPAHVWVGDPAHMWVGDPTHVWVGDQPSTMGQAPSMGRKRGAGSSHEPRMRQPTVGGTLRSQSVPGHLTEPRRPCGREYDNVGHSKGSTVRRLPRPGGELSATYNVASVARRAPPRTTPRARRRALRCWAAQCWLLTRREGHRDVTSS